MSWCLQSSNPVPAEAAADIEYAVARLDRKPVHDPAQQPLLRPGNLEDVLRDALVQVREREGMGNEEIRNRGVEIVSGVLRADLFGAVGHGNTSRLLVAFRRPIPPGTTGSRGSMSWPPRLTGQA